MIRTSILLSLALSAAMAAVAPVLAESYQLDGQLPMYPHGTLDAREASLTPAAIAHGVPLVLLTPDSTSTGNTWYGSHTPKTCANAHEGKTQIALIPQMAL